MNESLFPDDARVEKPAATNSLHWLNSLSPQVRRLFIGCAILFAGWVAFAIAVPHTIVATPPAYMSGGAQKTSPELFAPPAPQRPAENPAPENAALKPAAPEQPKSPAAPLAAAPQAPAPDKTLEALEAKVAAQSQAIEALQHQQEHALHVITLMDAYDRLKERVLSGKPFAEEMIRLRAAAGNDEALAIPIKALEGYANAGIPRIGMLQKNYSEAARKALHPAPQEGAGIVERLSASVSGVISIRRVGDVQGNTTEAVLARAEAALNRQEVDTAITELAALQGPAAQAMHPWLVQGMSYVAREGLLANLRSAILAHTPPS